MAQTELLSKNVKEYENNDVDAPLETLSPEELEQLGQDLIDPDVSILYKNEQFVRMEPSLCRL